MPQNSTPTSDSLLSPSFLFRFRALCRQAQGAGASPGVELSDQHQLVDWSELEGAPRFADVRIGWSEKGLAFSVKVTGKRQAPWCRESRPEDSDGLHVWIDTRDTHNIHRASRFCHRFAFIPFGAGDKKASPFCETLEINRAKESPKPAPAAALRATSERLADGYVLHASIGAKALTGYDPVEHPRLGFFYLVSDHELGWQTLSVGSQWPFQEDPTLWSTLDLANPRG